MRGTVLFSISPLSTITRFLDAESNFRISLLEANTSHRSSCVRWDNIKMKLFSNALYSTSWIRRQHLSSLRNFTLWLNQSSTTVLPWSAIPAVEQKYWNFQVLLARKQGLFAYTSTSVPSARICQYVTRLDSSTPKSSKILQMHWCYIINAFR